ncbi:MAG: DUF2330 domain-containing protein [Myxococcota bacterium]|nr:DUF2330 domain-containing protein [Myxococcota bacterium]
MGACLFCLLLSSQGWADGGILVSVRDIVVTDQQSAVEQGLVSSDGQRAVFWRAAAGTWELCIDPGRSAVDGAAWILPLPTLPEVSQIDTLFFDQLDAATSPVLETTTITKTTTTVYDYDYGSDRFFDCGCSDMEDRGNGRPVGTEESSSESQDSSTLPPPVIVWGNGTLGRIEYELISASSATALQEWLQANDYAVPETLASIAESYVAVDSYFFAAKFARSAKAAEAQRAEPIPAVCFALGEQVSPTYPMRLTKLSVPTGLSFSLWFVDARSNSFFYAPQNFDFRAIGSFDQGDATVPFPALYQARLDSISMFDALAVQYNATISSSSIATRVEKLGASVAAFPLDTEREHWHPRFKELVDAGYPVQRFYGSVPIAKMEDIVFAEQTQLQELSETGLHHRVVEVTVSDSQWSSVAPLPKGAGSATWGWLLVTLLPLLLWRRGGRRRQP